MAVYFADSSALAKRYIAGGLPFVALLSADLELNAAATTEGLSVENPNLHP